MNIFKRLRNLYRLSEIELPVTTSKGILGRKHVNQLIDSIIGKKQATIVETEDLPDMFLDHVEAP